MSKKKKKKRFQKIKQVELVFSDILSADYNDNVHLDM